MKVKQIKNNTVYPFCESWNFKIEMEWSVSIYKIRQSSWDVEIVRSKQQKKNRIKKWGKCKVFD